MKKIRNHPDELLIGLVSISDRASSGVYEDQGVPALITYCKYSQDLCNGERKL